MKIAVMVNSLMEVGGIAKHAISLSKEFANMGHEVTVWAVEYDKDNCYPALTEGLDMRSLRHTSQRYPKPGRVPGSGMIASLRACGITYQDQKTLFQKMPGGYDIINPHGNLIVWGAAEYRRRHKVPVVWMCNDFWPPLGVYQPKNGPSRAPRLAASLKKFASLPVTNYDRRVVREVDKIAVLSEIVRSQMEGYYGAAPVVVRKGVNTERFANGDGKWVRERFSVPEQSFLLLTICELMPRRRLEDVIEAVATLVHQGCDITYVIAGKTKHNPDYTRFIQAEVAARQLEKRVLIVGEVSEDELAGCYQASDAFIWQSDESQSWGSAGMEAMAAGKPVIVSKANGLAEILADGVNSFLVSPKSPDAIAEVIKKIIAEPIPARSVGMAGQRLMRENYSWRNYAQHMLELFQDAIAKPRDS